MIEYFIILYVGLGAISFPMESSNSDHANLQFVANLALKLVYILTLTWSQINNLLIEVLGFSLLKITFFHTRNEYITLSTNYRHRMASFACMQRYRK